MSNWFLVLIVILSSTVMAFTLAEWLSRRHSQALRRRLVLASGEPRDAGDPFDQDERAS